MTQFSNEIVEPLWALTPRDVLRTLERAGFYIHHPHIGLKPRARIRAYASIGSEPCIMLTGPGLVTDKVLQRAGMTKDERERTGLLLQQIAAERTVVVIEHDMEFLRRFASVVTVLHEGKVLTEGTVAEVQADPRVQEVYLGRKKEDAAAGSAAVLGLEATP